MNVVGKALVYAAPVVLGWFARKVMQSMQSPTEQKHEEKPESIEPSALEPDDLTHIVGIGPKITAILQDAGVYTFDRLSEMSEQEIRDILSQAGLGFAKPSSWPEQAKLAAAGRWPELEELQNSLRQ